MKSLAKLSYYYLSICVSLSKISNTPLVIIYWQKIVSNILYKMTNINV